MQNEGEQPGVEGRKNETKKSVWLRFPFIRLTKALLRRVGGSEKGGRQQTNVQKKFTF